MAMMLDFFGGAGGGRGAKADDACTGTELGRGASPGDEIGGIAWLAIAGDWVGVS